MGNGRVGEQFWLIAEHGMKAGYVRSIEQNPRVRIKLRDGLRSRWRTGTAHLLRDNDPRERQRWLAAQLPSSAKNASARPPLRYRTSHGSDRSGLEFVAEA